MNLQVSPIIRGRVLTAPDSNCLATSSPSASSSVQTEADKPATFSFAKSIASDTSFAGIMMNAGAKVSSVYILASGWTSVRTIGATDEDDDWSFD